VCLEKGLGIGKDLIRAAYYYRLSSEQGNTLGQYAYGRCLEHGCGIKKDLVHAVEYYRCSAHQGNSDGKDALARCLEDVD
jgi:TPR repeat protein